MRRDLLTARRLQDPTAAAGLAALDRQAESLAAQLARREEDRDRLTLRAPIAGTVVAPPRTSDAPAGAGAGADDPGAALSPWTGVPLDPGNRGAFLAPGTLAALVAPPDPRAPPGTSAGPVRAEARLVVPEAAVQRVRVGQRVRLKFAQRPGAVLTGRVTEVAAEALRTVPRELAGVAVAVAGPAPGADGLAAGGFGQGDPSALRPAETSYEVRVALDPDAPAAPATAGLLSRGVGAAKIRVAARPLWARAWETLRRTFRFDLG